MITKRTRTAGPTLIAATIGAAAIAALTAAASLAIGPTDDYARIFPPRWLALIAVTLVLASLLIARMTSSTRGTRAAGVLGWAAAVFFFGASGGAVLDGFRAFFWATGIPSGDFATVDWPGAIARAASLLAALVTVAWAWRLRAGHARDAGAAASARTRIAVAWCAVAFAVPYPLLKLVWWVQDRSSSPVDRTAGFPVMELLSFGAALVLVLLLTSSRRVPLPAWLLVACGLCASMALLSMGFLMVFGLLAQVTGVAAGSVVFASDGATLMVLGVYGTWLALGVVVLTATLGFIDARGSTRDAEHARAPASIAA
ncbi:hypothetical protein JOE59_002501 [Agromyces cerinus]|uniref:hypothetical protein n=1 Tax=Agromyces cerinus TaxID=33878 RepID=UPI00195A2026|nr:hypothetical protein [Agromyces cerinus]MBM7831796.1 hypothetical protein [Agromyces cerinus]